MAGCKFAGVLAGMLLCPVTMMLPLLLPRLTGWPLRIAGLLAAALLVGCAGGPREYTYRYVPGRTATVAEGGQAVAPSHAPRVVREAIDAGNRIAGTPYVYGGGHGAGESGGYDCSGATSYVLRSIGRLRGTYTSDEFRQYGRGGEGDWIDIYARRGHVFLVVAGLRFDTGWNGGSHDTGPRWSTRSRATDGCVIRHPPGL